MHIKYLAHCLAYATQVNNICYHYHLDTNPTSINDRSSKPVTKCTVALKKVQHQFLDLETDNPIKPHQAVG